MNRQQDKYLTQAEREMLKTQWTSDIEREKQAERERQILNRERNLGLLKHNEQEKTLKSQAEMAERQRDL